MGISCLVQSFNTERERTWGIRLGGTFLILRAILRSMGTTPDEALAGTIPMILFVGAIGICFKLPPLGTSRACVSRSLRVPRAYMYVCVAGFVVILFAKLYYIFEVQFDTYESIVLTRASLLVVAPPVCYFCLHRR